MNMGTPGVAGRPQAETLAVSVAAGQVRRAWRILLA